MPRPYQWYPCVYPGCENPKVDGQGQRFCHEHKASAAARRDARRAAKRAMRPRARCQHPECGEPKLRGYGYRYCAEHSAESFRRWGRTP